MPQFTLSDAFGVLFLCLTKCWNASSGRYETFLKIRFSHLMGKQLLVGVEIFRPPYTYLMFVMRGCIFLMNMPVPTYSLDRASGLPEMHIHRDVEFFHHPLAGILSHSVSDICEPE